LPNHPEVWYVSYRSNINPKRDDESHVVRGTRRFSTETDAKKFAEEVVRNGWRTIAGTINPHKPRKAIPSTKILDWIAGKL
jgi:hypothetical protein